MLLGFVCLYGGINVFASSYSGRAHQWLPFIAEGAPAWAQKNATQNHEISYSVEVKALGHLFRVLILLISTISYTKSKDLPYSRPDDRFATEHVLP